MDFGGETHPDRPLKRHWAPIKGRPPDVAEHPGIAFQRARIGIEVFVRAELGRIDKNRNNHGIGLAFSLPLRVPCGLHGARPSSARARCGPLFCATFSDTLSRNESSRLMVCTRGAALSNGCVLDSLCGMHLPGNIKAFIANGENIRLMAGPHHIVFANEKGGTGKSTTAVHVAIALASRGARVGLYRPRFTPTHACTAISKTAGRDNDSGVANNASDARDSRYSNMTRRRGWNSISTG